MTNRDNFDHRFGDDLFELIISYLSIEDKIKYESVSKRFQRFVFNKQKTLIINYNRQQSSRNQLLRQLIKNNNLIQKNLKSLLKKFPSITTIVVKERWLKNMTDIVNTIANNCLHLTSVDIDLIEVKPQILKKFCERFGPKLRHISMEFHYFCRNQEVAKHLLQCSPNIRSISNLGITSIDQILSQKLEQIKDLNIIDANQQKFELLSSQSFLNLKYLSIYIEILTKPDIESIEQFSQLTKLRNLKIETNLYIENGSDIWAKTLELIASNCHSLQYLSFKCEFKKDFITNKCFQSLAHFCGLKTLQFISNRPVISTKDEELDLKALKNCKDLLSLDLRFCAINDYTFDGIDIIVPKLRQLTFESSLTITDRAFQSIAKLKDLTHIEITGRTKVGITRTGVQNLIESCKRLKLFRTRCGVLYKKYKEAIHIKRLTEMYPNIELDVHYCN